MKLFHIAISLCVFTILLTSCQSNEANDPALPTSLSGSQSASEFKTLDEQYLEIGEQIPGFAGIYKGADGTLVAKIAASTTLSAQQSSSDDVTVPEVRDAIIEVMGTEVFTGVPNDLAASMGSLQTREEAASSLALRLESTKYTFEQLYTWLTQIAALDLDGVMIYDANEGKNNVYLGVETKAQADVTKARVASLPIPHDAVVVEVVGPFDDLVLRGRELQNYLTQRGEEATEAQLEASAAVQYVDGQNNPLVGGVEISVPNVSICTYGFSAKRNGVLGFVSNSHCTRNKNRVNGDEVYQRVGKIGYETVDPSVWYCGPFWNMCRYSDAAFFRNTGARVAAPRIAGTGPAAGDKSYTYTSRVRGRLYSTWQGEHYIAVTCRTGFARLIVTNTCTYLRTYGSPSTVECGAVAKPEPGYPNVQGGDSGSPVITRDTSGAVLVAQIFGGNPITGSIWMNNSSGIWRDLGDMAFGWSE